MGPGDVGPGDVDQRAPCASGRLCGWTVSPKSKRQCGWCDASVHHPWAGWGEASGELPPTAAPWLPGGGSFCQGLAQGVSGGLCHCHWGLRDPRVDRFKALRTGEGRGPRTRPCLELAGGPPSPAPGFGDSQMFALRIVPWSLGTRSAITPARAPLDGGPVNTPSVSSGLRVRAPSMLTCPCLPGEGQCPSRLR